MSKIKLSDISTLPPAKLDKEATKALTHDLLTELDELQNLLYAEHKWSVLVIVQGMDASGKDGLIRHVLSRLNPQGVTVHSFKAPDPVEQDHDFLWRVHKQAPGKGMIQVFNRSHYEDVLIQRVHKWIDEKTTKQRMRAINDFERLLTEHNRTKILKFYLHVSPKEQRRRLDERMKDRKKMWKYNEDDFKEAKLWKEYMQAYEDVFNRCSEIPWNIVPADHNWYKEHVVAQTLRNTLRSLKMQYPGMKK